MSNPLPPAIHGHAEKKLQLRHFEGGGMAMAHEISNQRAVVGNALGSFAIADAGRLHDRGVVSHQIHEANKSVVKNGKFFPAQLVNQFVARRHDGP